jgi:hypothetical protein
MNHDLRSAGAQIVYFEASGAFILWSGTIFSMQHKSPIMSEGDAETIYSGSWT